MDLFPPEIWDSVFDFLHPKNLIKLAQISPCFAEIIILNKNLRMRVFLFSSNMSEKDRIEQLLWACGGGHLKVLQWLHSTFSLTEEDARSRDNDVLQWACENGHLEVEVCRWLHSVFNV